MAIAAIMALFKITVRAENILFAGGYLLVGNVASLLTWSDFFIAGWLGPKQIAEAQSLSREWKPTEAKK